MSPCKLQIINAATMIVVQKGVPLSKSEIARILSLLGNKLEKHLNMPSSSFCLALDENIFTPVPTPDVVVMVLFHLLAHGSSDIECLFSPSLIYSNLSIANRFYQEDVDLLPLWLANFNPEIVQAAILKRLFAIQKPNNAR